ncbi:hypothetical protein NBRC116594_27050 [Shimia sp. NS0008-38b]|uniref:hypothetical protein n=1 Tax=Shimia sp. NS0008-38b TaxID=3127653 RepID=UPI00310A6EEC
MKYALAPLLAVALVTACGPTPSASARKAKSLNQDLQTAALKDAQQITIDGTQFQVRKVTGSYSATTGNDPNYSDAPYALVNRIAPQSASFTGQDVEQAARKATGCRSKLNGGILSFLRTDLATENLAEIEDKIKSDFVGWYVDLTC